MSGSFSCCSGSASEPTFDRGRPNSLKIDAQLEIDEREYRKVNKLLVLGTPNSGADAFYKQILDLHCGGISEQDRRDFYTGRIHRHIIRQMQLLLAMVLDDFKVDLSGPLSKYRGITWMISIVDELRKDSLSYGDDSSEETEETPLEEKSEPSKEELQYARDLVQSADLIKDLPIGAQWDADVARAIGLLWADQRVRDAFECRITTQITDTAPYFFDDHSHP